MTMAKTFAEPSRHLINHLEAKRPSLVLDWRLALGAVFLLAFAVRFMFLGHDTLSHHEAGRALRFWSTSLDEMRMSPPLQYAIWWMTRHILGAGEFAMRLPSAVAGVACVGVLFLFVRSHVDAWSGVCVAAVAACHPELVRFSRIIKEFSFEALTCVVVVWVGAQACRSLSVRHLRIFLVASVIAIGFSYTGPLVVASWLVMITWAATRSGTDRRVVIKYLVYVGAVLALTVALWYLWLSGGFRREALSSFYEERFQAWPIDYSLATLASWLVGQSYGALKYVLGITAVWPPMDTLVGGYGLVLGVASASVLLRKARSFCLATLLIVGLAAFFGAMKLWPYGPYCTMTFLTPLMCIAIGCGLRQLMGSLGASPVVAVLALVCVLFPAARSVKSTIVNPSETEHLRPVLNYIDRHARPGDGLFAYYPTRWAVRYYWPPDQFRPQENASIRFKEERYDGKRAGVEVLLQPTDDRGDLMKMASRFKEFLAVRKRVWFVFTHEFHKERKEWIGHLENRFRLADKFESADASVHLFVERSTESVAQNDSPSTLETQQR